MSAEGKASIFTGMQEAFISIVVPVFNEAENLIDNLDMLISEIEPFFKKFEIIVISDGSRDGTNVEMFRFQHAGVRYKIFPQNVGKGAVVRAGFEAAKGDFIFFIDGGMELHPRELRIFLGLLFLYEVDIVIGSKRHPQSQVYYPWYRKFLSFLYQKLIQFLFEIDVTDTQVGMKLFRKEVVQAILPHLEIDRYGFDLEILSLAKIKGFDKILEAPIRLDYFNNSERMALFDFFRVLKMGFSLLKDTIRLYNKLQKVKSNEPVLSKQIPA